MTGRWSQVELGDDPVVVLALGAQLFDAADDASVGRMNFLAEQQLYAALTFFRHGALPESWR
jgi:hypothetical protein